MPIFMTRLVDDSGWIMTGGPAQLGSWATVSAIRSPTHWRAWRTFVPGLKIISIDESCGTDFDRMTSRPGTPLRASSSGTVTSDSTSDGDSPRDGVCTSTFGGANSGKTSTGSCFSCIVPSSIIPTASPRTRKRNLRLVATIRRIIGCSPAPRRRWWTPPACRRRWWRRPPAGPRAGGPPTGPAGRAPRPPPVPARTGGTAPAAGTA